MNKRIVSYFLGNILKIEALSMVVPCIIAFCCHENSSVWFLLSIVICLCLGFPMGQKKFSKGSFFAREGFVITALSWIILSLIGAIPFYGSGKIPSYIDAVFEIVSGFTTTGSTILSSVEALGYGLLFWRSFSHWIGGMGVLVLLLSLMPSNGGYNMQIMKAESPGPSVSKLVPKVRDTAKILYMIYIVLTLAAIICYLLSGMPLFDALCIGFGTAGTGGFGVRDTGMADYNVVSQAFISIFMILFGVNFNVYYLVFRHRFNDALHSEEVKWYIIFIAIAVIIGMAGMSMTEHCNILYSFHHSLFTIASLISSTGFATADFNLWPSFAKAAILMIMFCGACAGSTGGGFKVSRVMILLKQAKSELHLLIHPNAVRPIRLEGKKLDQNTLRSVNHYFAIYMLILAVSVFLVSFDGFDLETNISAVFATLNNIGPGFSMVGPYGNFADFSVFSKIILIFDMIAGRLEIIPVLILLYPKTWTRHF